MLITFERHKNLILNHIILEYSKMATKKRKCTFGDKCYRKNKDHLENYDHPFKDDEEVVNKKTKIEENIESKSELVVEAKKELVEQNEDDIRKLVLEENKMQMPEDFYDFLEFCKSINKKDPKNALESADIQLVGVFDLILSNKKADYKLYYRYFYDPPEFQTVLKGNNETQLHFGYFRDDPNKLPDFVAINEAKVNCKIVPKGENIFCAVSLYIDELLKCTDAKEKHKDLLEIKKKLVSWCEKSKHEWPLQLKTPKIKIRDKNMNCKTFHEAGICVPVNEQGFGYREVPESYGNAKLNKVK